MKSVIDGLTATRAGASAARADYVAAAAVLTREHQTGQVDELAGDEAYTLAEPAAEIARPSGKNGVYQNLLEADFKAARVGAGLPEPLASLWAESDVGVSTGALFDDGHPLSRLIGRPTTPLATLVKSALQAPSGAGAVSPGSAR